MCVNTMNWIKILITALTVLVLVLSVATSPVYADHDEEEEDDEPTIDINLSGVIDAINNLKDAVTDFTGNWEGDLKDLLISIILAPFATLRKIALDYLVLLLTHTPDVHPNPAVEEIHNKTLLVTFLFSTLGVVAAGVLHMVGPVFGISYSQVRIVLPRLLIALAFAIVSLPVLQLGVELSNAFVFAFQPNSLETSVQQSIGVNVSVALAIIIEAWLLLAVIALLIIKDIYILFVAAVSPLLALLWSFPKTRRYSDTFIAGFFAALAIGPADMLVFRFILALMKGNGTNALQSVSNWILAVAGFTLLLIVPYQIYGASQSIVGQSQSLARGTKARWNKQKAKNRSGRRKQQGKPHARNPSKGTDFSTGGFRGGKP